MHMFSNRPGGLRRRLPLIVSFVALALGTLGQPAWATKGKPPHHHKSCAELVTLKLPDTVITAAHLVAAGSYTAPNGQTLSNLPAFCRVAAVIAPQINFEVWMPTETWNGKFNGVGQGGYVGSISYSGLAASIARGYAAATTDAGHQAGGFDGSWALNRPDLVVDLGYRAVHEMTDRSKRILQAFYGKRPKYSYYTGCSGGGHQGLMNAQRFPKDYDGIVAGAPAYDITGMHAWFTWSAQATLKDPASYIPSSKLPVVTAAVNARCDAIDGVVDGIIDDPRKCDFDPAVLQCTDSDAPNCLTAAQVTALRKLYAGPSNPRTGERIYPGVFPGAEVAAGWGSWITGVAPNTSLHYSLASNGIIKYAVFGDPNWDWRTFDFDADMALTREKLSAALDATDPDLRRFKAHGGKLIMYHGWADPAFSAQSAVDYYERVVAFMQHGKNHGLKRTQEFFRFFPVPGMGHCSGGAGPSSVDWLAELEKWVENGEAPERIIASSPQRTRPLCAYPNRARYVGGDPNDAASFVCEAP